MNYKDLSLEELKAIAKEKGVTVGNMGQAKLAEKLEQYDKDHATLNAVNDNDDGDDANDENIAVVDTPDNKEITTENVIEEISNVMADLEDFEDDDKRDGSIGDIDNNEEVACKSITYGGLTYISPIDSSIYRWDKLGAIQYLTVKELITMNNTKPAFLNRPWIILQDIRAVNKFRLMPKYEDVAEINKLKKYISENNIDKINEIIDNGLKAGMREVIISKVRSMYNHNKLNNTHIIKAIEDKLKFDIAED